jgi:hypothetical protein
MRTTGMTTIAISGERDREIRISCERALRRLDRLAGERDDVLLRHARELVRRAAALAALSERRNCA